MPRDWPVRQEAVVKVAVECDQRQHEQHIGGIPGDPEVEKGAIHQFNQGNGGYEPVAPD